MRVFSAAGAAGQSVLSLAFTKAMEGMRGNLFTVRTPLVAD
ncbi:hypothetical protein [Paenibacillus jilunlii]|nr:hypothetical protein [Paenibacillus jilunlii]